jgi:hypothetical protein
MIKNPLGLSRVTLTAARLDQHKQFADCGSNHLKKMSNISMVMSCVCTCRNWMMPSRVLVCTYVRLKQSEQIRRSLPNLSFPLDENKNNIISDLKNYCHHYYYDICLLYTRTVEYVVLFHHLVDFVTWGKPRTPSKLYF